VIAVAASVAAAATLVGAMFAVVTSVAAVGALVGITIAVIAAFLQWLQRYY
jgi:hypothetical protein